MFRTQLLTAQRPGDVSRMRWAQLEPALFHRNTNGLVLPSKLQRLRKRCGFKFIAHDLRRTAATLMADAGVPENIISKVLNRPDEHS